MGIEKTFEPVGLLAEGTVLFYDKSTGKVKVKLVQGIDVSVPLPNSLIFNNNSFIGAIPPNGTNVILGKSSGGSWYFVSFVNNSLSNIPSLNKDELLIKTNDQTKISLNLDNDISIGSKNNKIHINSERKLISSNFENQYNFTQGSRHVIGIVKRDKVINKTVPPQAKLDDDSYDRYLIPVGLDPQSTTEITVSGKNPSFVENRELIYEFQYDANISDDLTESSLYNNQYIQKKYNLPNRRQSRCDTLSLTLMSPNYLMETVKGTVIDIFGNILDLNRFPVQVGTGQYTFQDDKNNDKSKTFLNIRELERKSLAFHFEINARKDFTGNDNKVVFPDINSNKDYARNRSRFFIDIDKEGQFKVNVPASSETGNIPLLTRYENYSTVSTDDNSNPNKIQPTDDNLDIVHDSFAAPKATLIKTPEEVQYSTEKGSISLIGDKTITSPKDRITNGHIKHGTVFHDILQTCYVHQTNDFMKYPNEYGEPYFTIDVDNMPVLKNIVSETINISGDKANAGGRSGSITFDGSIEMNIGANTIDRQSLWLDTAGGIVANIGRDKNYISSAISMNGKLLLQVGGIGVEGDSRFSDQINKTIAGEIDIRVLNSGGRVSVIRINDQGIIIMSPGQLQIYSGQDMTIKSDCQIDIEAETVKIQGRAVQKEFGGSI